MDSGSLIAFLTVAVLVTISPGQDMALVLRNTLWADRRAGTLTAIGIVSGLVVWAVVASAGLAALLLSSRPLFAALKVGGALYLGYLGLKALRAALRHSRIADPETVTSKPKLGDLPAYRQGLLSNLANPKVAVFYTSLLPQFAGEGSAFGSLLALGLLHCLIGLIWLVGYASVLDWAGVYLRRSRVMRAIDAVTGLVLVGLAVRLATARR